MNPIDEIEYIYRLPLRNFSKTGYGFNFSCPICKEGKSPWKKRGFVLLANRNHTHNSVICKNCDLNTNIEKFIQMLDESLYQEFVRANRKNLIRDLREGKINRKFQEIKNDFGVSESGLKLFNLNPKAFIPLKRNSDAIKYCIGRKIPENLFESLYYCIHPKCTWTNMVIFPFWKGEKIYGFQGRSIKEKRFNTFSKNDGFKVYNIFNVDMQKTVYVFESIIDSMMVDNSIAMVGADLSEVIQERLNRREIYAFDNDDTGINKSIKYLEKGKKVFCWPNELSGIKDANQAIVQGMTRDKLHKIINENVVEGIAGSVRLKMKLINKKR